MDNSLNFYELLGVSENATSEEIKSAYKKQMKKWHPDINKSNDASNMSIKLNEAKDVLLDENKRKDYDEYLKQKIEENYNRYTQMKNNSANYNTNEKYQEKTLTKWQYLNEWLKYVKVSPIRKIVGVTGVLLESLLCLLIKYIIILFAYMSSYGSYIIRYIYSILAPIFGIFAVLLFGLIATNGFENTFNENQQYFIIAFGLIGVYIFSFILPLISNLLLSEKTFNILYNKIDITLFKKCVGYKD